MMLEYGRLTATHREMSGEERAVWAAYRAMLQRDPKATELAECTAQMRTSGLSLGGLAGRLIASAEFQRRFATPPPVVTPTVDPVVEQAYTQVVASLGPNLTDAQFIHAAYQALLDRLPDTAGCNTALQGLRSATISRRDIIAGILASPEYGQEHPTEVLPTAEELYQNVEAECGANASDEAFLRTAYQSIFNRMIDVTGREYYLRRFERNTITRQEVIESMMASSEYQRVINKIVDPLNALHQMRMILFQQHLPSARRVLDLGGAAHNHDEGALLLLGYPHRPEEITIIDLPPEDRIGGTDAAEKQREIVTGDGIRIRYLYRSMADLADIPDANFDLIVSGETIEHISEADADIVCREAFRILVPGGSFCLDTPNAALTRLQMPDQFIHPEHQKEYLVQEIRDLLTCYGFELSAQKAICPMPESLRTRQFDINEISRNISLSDQPEEGYLFYIHAVKPAA
jgi:SAM-dependent methyltransferase